MGVWKYELYKNSYLNLEIYYKNIHNIDVELVNKLVYFVRINSKTKNNNKANIVLVLTKQKKYITYDIDNITPYNTNSGYSISGEIILIWRTEEIYKVIIHELCHYYNIDNNVKTNIKLSKIFNIDDNVDSQIESYIETCATIFNSLIYSKTHNINFVYIINYEIKFSFYQVTKILNYYGAVSVSDMIDNKILNRQKTSVLSYYIIKLGMLLNINELFELWKLNNLNIKNNSEEYNIFYINSINVLKKYNNIFENITIERKSKFINKTLRMTMHEL